MFIFYVKCLPCYALISSDTYSAETLIFNFKEKLLNGKNVSKFAIPHWTNEILSCINMFQVGFLRERNKGNLYLEMDYLRRSARVQITKYLQHHY